MVLRPDPILPFNCGSCGERLRHVRTDLTAEADEPAHFYVCSSCGQVWTLDARGHFARARDQVFKPARQGTWLGSHAASQKAEVKNQK